MSLRIYYDGDCPFCSRYVRYQRLTSAMDVEQVNLREMPEKEALILKNRFDLDKGMLVEFGGCWYAGADAMHLLSVLASPAGLSNKILMWTFRYRILVYILYPVLRVFRNLSLLFLGRKPINASEPKSSLLLFSVCFGLFAYLHFLVYAFDFRSDLYVTSYIVPLLGISLLFFVGSLRLLLLLFVFMIWDAWLQAPVFSNHTIIKNFFLLGVAVGGVYSALRAYSWNVFFDTVAPVGRALLLIMYIFGVFHKINSDFLNPEVSCAVALWQAMPPPFYWLDTLWFRYLAIYGTLLIETLIFAGLLIPRFRHWSIVLGIVFHSLLAFSGYALYTAFSMLSLVLHILFLSDASAQRIMASPLVKKASVLRRTYKGKLLLASFVLALLLYSQVQLFPVVSIIWCAFVIPLMWLILKYGKDVDDRRGMSIFISRQWGLNAISLLFLFNCMTPYFGLKTAQSINMFANLRMEGGSSNHLLLPSPPGPFRYLEDLVSIESYSGNHYFNYIKKEGLYITWYDFLNRLERQPGAKVDFQRNGQIFEGRNLVNEMENELHPRWFRKWFHFVPVDLSSPKLCALDR